MTLRDYFVENVKLGKEWAHDLNSGSLEDLPLTSRTKVWWRCEQSHTWQAEIGSRIYAGRNCPYCANQSVISGENDMATLSPEMRKRWHPDKNGELKPTDITAGSRRRVWWQCERGHAWQAPPYSIKAGSACPYCSGRNAIPGETDLATTHPQVTKLWSGKNKLLPTEVMAGSHKKVLWVCEKGHEWEAIVCSVAIDGCGCPYCAGKRAVPGETDLATQRPDLMEQWDFERNTLDPEQITAASHDKVWWKCARGHSWEAMVFSRTRKLASGCPYCTGRKVLAGFNDLATLKPKIAEEWYEDLNGDLKPEDVTLGSNKKVWWKCRDGHVWMAAVYSRTRRKGTGCPVCAGVVKQRKVDTREKKGIQSCKRSGKGPVRISV